MFHSFQRLTEYQQGTHAAIRVPFIRYPVASINLQATPEIQFDQLTVSAKVMFILRQLAKSFRLMVGVHDYPTYVRHMLEHHPDQTVMSEKQFHRRCLEARYPSQGGKMNKCPC